jgi:hypothetical protein
MTTLSQRLDADEVEGADRAAQLQAGSAMIDLARAQATAHSSR